MRRPKAERRGEPIAGFQIAHDQDIGTVGDQHIKLFGCHGLSTDRVFKCVSGPSSTAPVICARSAILHGLVDPDAAPAARNRPIETNACVFKRLAPSLVSPL